MLQDVLSWNAFRTVTEVVCSKKVIFFPFGSRRHRRCRIKSLHMKVHCLLRLQIIPNKQVYRFQFLMLCLSAEPRRKTFLWAIFILNTNATYENIFVSNFIFFKSNREELLSSIIEPKYTTNNNVSICHTNYPSIQVTIVDDFAGLLINQSSKIANYDT